MNRILLGHSSNNIGRHSGVRAGGPNYCVRRRRFRIPRLLYHSGLDHVIEYPFAPTRTKNFHLDLLPRVDWTEAKTLSANLTQQWESVAHDVIVKEIFEGQITGQQSLLAEFYRHWVTLFNVGEFGIWAPLDLTDKVYRARVVNLLLDGEEFDPSAVGGMMDKWLTATIEVWIKIMPSFAPNASMYAAGGSV